MVPDDVSLSAPITSQREPGQSFSIDVPGEQTIPLVFASPHSGQEYPADFIAASRLPPLALRRSEDAFIDRIFGTAPRFGAPLIRAHFPRVYVDPNREPYELDPGMFDAPLPRFVNDRSPRVAAGLGTIAKVVANGENIYRDKVNVDEALQRIGTHYFPYHAAIKGLLEQTRQRFGCYLLIDCHSMPSVGGPMDADPGLKRLDIVLGDCFGSSCHPMVTATAERVLSRLGFTVRRNVPYAGGFTTRNYAQPRDGLHTLQIEVNRTLYMNEERIEPSAGFDRVAHAMTTLIAAFAELDTTVLKAG